MQIDPRVRIGHVHLKPLLTLNVRSAFTAACWGSSFEACVMAPARRSSRRAATIITSVSIPGRAWVARPRPRGTTRPLVHLAILYPTRATLADALLPISLRAGIVRSMFASVPRGERGALPARPRPERRRVGLGPCPRRGWPHALPTGTWRCLPEPSISTRFLKKLRPIPDEPTTPNRTFGGKLVWQ